MTKSYNPFQFSLGAKYGMATFRGENYKDVKEIIDELQLAGTSGDPVARFLLNGLAEFSEGKAEVKTSTTNRPGFKSGGYQPKAKILDNDRLCPGHNQPRERKSGEKQKEDGTIKQWVGFFCNADVAKEEKCAVEWG